MAEAKTQELKPSGALQTIQGISEKPVFRQIALMVGIAASVALGAAVIMWSQSPDYTVLYHDMPESQLAEISDALKQQGIEYKVDPVNGKVMVPAADINKARMNLASLGLNKVAPKGFEMLNQEQGFGTSQFIQSARYHKAMEDELSLSVASMRNIKNARVHLAIPKQSVFIRDKKKPSASVILEMYAGRTLSKEQIQAITNMVSSSVQELEAGNVTVVDQMGRLLSDHDKDDSGLNDKQMQYTYKLEEDYNQKIRNILSPFLGKNGFSVQVKASLDFNRKEVTSEQYNPDLSAVRSKQQLVEHASGAGEMGIPGSLSNQPPGGSIVPEKTKENADGGSKGKPYRSRESLTENFEVDKSISYVSYSTGTLEQLSVAVVVDDKKIADAEGKVTTTPRTAEEIQRITSLVKEAVGYNIQRGDTVNVVNASFVTPEPLEALPEPAIWEQVWFSSLIKQVLAGFVVIYLLFGIIKPAFKNLSRPHGKLVDEQGNVLEVSQDGTVKKAIGMDGVSGEGKSREEMLGLEEKTVDADGNPILTQDEKYIFELDLARKMVTDEPKIAAQLIKLWVNEGNE